MRVGTVHTFQSGERDVMVFSLVAGAGMHDCAIGWVHRQLNLWNVAITRARSHLIVVGDMNLWRRWGGVASELLNAATTTGPRIEGHAGDDLLQRLYQVMSTQPGTTAALGESVHGHSVDVLVRSQDAARRLCSCHPPATTSRLPSTLNSHFALPRTFLKREFRQRRTSPEERKSAMTDSAQPDPAADATIR
ncbi:hypothetical protein SRB17_75970 [Streptomyces sp. RB17]|uniref:AAA domain-containing protein n=1 Tax=Streptomyces sp. RB17 TaxID=2585197 RepID=UPI001308690E|nr:AAA domain-containing protein [Streptomyces sp. RB17]MQY39570.1 hypothetical protein [Streptomyces sp. RB17]